MTIERFGIKVSKQCHFPFSKDYIVSRNLKFTEILFTIFVNDILRTFLGEQMRAIIKYESGRIRAFYLLFSLTYLLSLVQLNGIDENLSTHRANDQFFNPTPFESSHFVARQERKKTLDLDPLAR